MFFKILFGYLRQYKSWLGQAFGDLYRAFWFVQKKPINLTRMDESALRSHISGKTSREHEFELEAPLDKHR